MRRIFIAAAMSLCVVSVAAVSSADTLIMRDGTRVSGRVVCVTAQAITFEDVSGVVRRYHASQVNALEFTTAIERTAAAGTSGRSRRNVKRL